MKKLMQINVVSDIGSTGRITAQLLKYADKNGFEPYMAYGFGKSTFKNSFKISSGWFVHHFHGFLERKLGMSGYYSCYDTWRLIRWIKKVDPDIIHLHNLHGAYLNFKMFFKYLRVSNKIVIWTLHDCWAFTGGCAHFTYYNCYKWQADCKGCEFLNSIYKGNIYGNTARVLADKKKAYSVLTNMQIFAVSKWLASAANQSILKEYNVQTKYNGIDTDIFKPSDIDLKKQLGIEGKFMILGIANVWGKGKGLKDFLKLGEQLGDHYQVVLIGLSELQIKDLPKNIIGISRTGNLQQLREFYSAADVFINFSIEETFGLTVGESLACGTPAIIMNSTACPELIDEKTGIAVDVGDFDGILSAVKEIEEKRKEFYSENCRKRCIRNFSSALMVKNYLKEYEKVICNK